MRTSRAARSTALVVISALTLAACGGASGDSSSGSGSASSGTLRVALNNTTDSLAVIVAQKQGFFAKRKISVKTTTLNDITLVPGLLGKQYDVGFTVAPILIRAKASGLGVVMIAGNNGDSPTDQPVQIYVRKGITNVKQLAGKRIGSPTLTGNINIATKAWLSANGVDPTGVNYVQVPTPNMVDQLKAGQVDAVEVIYPFINLAKQAGLTTLGDPERVLSNSYVGGTYWSASQSWAKKNPVVVANFRAAMQEADKWIAANSDAAYAEAAAYTKVPVAQAKASPLGEYTTEVSAADLKIWGDAMKKFGGFNGNIDYAGMVDTGK